VINFQPKNFFQTFQFQIEVPFIDMYMAFKENVTRLRDQRYQNQKKRVSEINKLRAEAKLIKTDMGHRQSQKSAWESVRCSYGQCGGGFQQGYGRGTGTAASAGSHGTSGGGAVGGSMVALGKGKYWDFGGRKNRYASSGDARTAEYYLTGVIPQEMKKLNTQWDNVAAKEQALSAKYQAEELAYIAKEKQLFEDENIRVVKEEKKFERRQEHGRWVNLGQTTRSPARRHQSGATSRYQPPRRR
tara:strand:+ start:5424 stop:6155 length:732 start_codon:yes stop_codon:yes gene_type:complete